MLKAKCLYIDGYEWLLVEDREYEVLSWTDDAIVINDNKCGMFGLERERFEFDVPVYSHYEFDHVIGKTRYYPVNNN